MLNRFIYILCLTLILSSCTGSRYSSESILKQVDFENIESIEIDYYYTELNKSSDTSYNEYVSRDIINKPINIELNNNAANSLKNSIKYFLNNFPDSRKEPYKKDELIVFKKNYLRTIDNDTFDIDSIYNMSRKKRGTRNILSYRYSMRLNFHSEDEKSLSIWKSNDNIVSYSFCCTDYKNNWIYKITKGYDAYSLEYILDIEFQRRYIEMFNSILSYYNRTNGTDYPLLDVEYEIWSGIISDD